jgi:hypothetical protein
MKTSILILSLTLFSVSLYSQEVFTDIKEFGLKGKVKSIESNYYSVKENRQELTLDTLNSKSLMHFNENGNLTIIVNFTFSGEEIERIKYQRDDNERKISYKKYNENGIFETGKYNWINERKYQIKAKDSFGIRIESEFTLSKKFRDESGTTTYYDDKTGEYFLTYHYQNILDENGNLLSSNNIYKPLGNSSTIIYDVQELDEFGNWIKVSLYDDEKDFRQIMIRKIEYYK